jgi:hypothetical protein
MTTAYEIESPIGPKYCDRLSQGLHYVVIVYTQYSQYRGHQLTPRAHYIDMEVVYTQRTPHLDHHVTRQVHYIPTAPRNAIIQWRELSSPDSHKYLHSFSSGTVYLAYFSTV